MDEEYYAQAFHAIVGSPADILIELAAFIDVQSGFVAGSDEEVGPLTTDVESLVIETDEDGQLEPEKLESAITLVLGSADALGKASDKEFEPVFNLLLYILVSSPAGLADHLARLLELLSNSSSTHALPVLSVLTNLFNLLPATSNLRHSVFLTVLKTAVATGHSSLLLPQLSLLPTWFEEWKLVPKDQVDLLLTVAAELDKVDESAALKYYQESHSAAKLAGLSVPAEATIKLVQLSLKDNSFVEYDSVLAATSPEVPPNLVELLGIFVSGTLAQYKDFKTRSADVLATYGLDDAALTTKIRLLTLSSLAAAAPSLTVSYAAIASALDISDDEVEFWVIDVIRAGLLEGKMSQLEKKLYVHRVASRTFGAKEWEDVARRLDIWKQSLKDVLGVVKNARLNVQAKLDAPVEVA